MAVQAQSILWPSVQWLVRPEASAAAAAAAVAIISPYSVADCTLSLRGSTNSFVEVASMLRGSLVCATFDVNFLRRLSDNL